MLVATVSIIVFLAVLVLIASVLDLHPIYAIKDYFDGRQVDATDEWAAFEASFKERSRR